MSGTKKVKSVDAILEKITKTIESIDDIDERAQILNWLDQFCRYKSYEQKFKPYRLKKYGPGDLISADFGYNIGSEFRGVHFAVVVEDNHKNSPTVMVIPLSSYQHKSQVSQYHIDLGIIKSLNEYKGLVNVGTRAVPNQMRPIDKIRIYYPKKDYQTLGRISEEGMHLIGSYITKTYGNK